ncbi:hypothetical protein C8J35_10282 [Rhizobium sp. PP-F2F-G38]|uniref:Uncharacterized protein n=1 Tax=Ferranicluibacter rubi TaxID=2715133 RepID=A0AA43ZEQ8_9HYPH|nr:hypothetical protein [Ferranicluibacter rubi]PYE35701.1 hypothetical protein C8J37_10283 [Rhizobium sp. PP-WC-1G-195]PYE99195.1 hypothetical protein C8J35_10282 [Rhizobium sp. PP-F2F-G38]TCP87227.1 hypothetical protein C8J31_10588 [Rhizobium sp. PP-CC-2G-626]TCQ12630.1 hypothetical protein C8J34_1011273 [Rhizobium sp. PP-F2F-G36]TCQ28624.1 hypothetical protein C8J33_1011277 [Rhizobium sp. PP-CC-3G-465]
MSSNVEPRTFGHGTMEGNRDVEACKATLGDAFQAVTTSGEVSMGSAAGAEIPSELQELIKQAEASGWHRDVAEEAIRQLARELLGARGASFD